MPKTTANESVVHDWVSALTFQMQALLFTGMRGPDGLTKHNTAKALVRYLRGAVLKPAGKWNGLNNNDFMWGDYSDFHKYATAFFENHDEYPHHFIMHLIHCAEVIGYYHFNEHVREEWICFYINMCKAMHMTRETKEEMDNRLNDFGCGYNQRQ